MVWSLLYSVSLIQTIIATSLIRQGIGLRKHTNVPTLIEFFRGMSVENIACGFLHSLALTANGALYAWGNITSDHLGLSENGNVCVCKVCASCDMICGVM